MVWYFPFLQLEQSAAFINQWVLHGNVTNCTHIDEDPPTTVCDDTNLLQEAERRCYKLMDEEGM